MSAPPLAVAAGGEGAKVGSDGEGGCCLSLVSIIGLLFCRRSLLMLVWLVFLVSFCFVLCVSIFGLGRFRSFLGRNNSIAVFVV